MKKIVAIVAGSMLAVGALSGCSSLTEPFNDAPISSKNDKPAEVYSFPDGYNNVASKCDNHGNRIFVVRTGDGRGVAVVPNDPSCKN
jgi:hypothetical protein